ncbi:MAG: hypothetical protein HUU38_25520, partial [Anaerolineales bacterium]|nr:hypothetical protein [Anaerolineales bacterium]
MNLKTFLTYTFVRLNHWARRFLFAPESFGVKAFHLMVAISMITPNFLGVGQLVQAAYQETKATQPVQAETEMVPETAIKAQALPVRSVLAQAI